MLQEIITCEIMGQKRIKLMRKTPFLCSIFHSLTLDENPWPSEQQWANDERCQIIKRALDDDATASFFVEISPFHL